MTRLRVVVEVLEAGEAGPSVTLAELRARLGGETGLLPDPRGGAAHRLSLEDFRGASPQLRLRVSFTAEPAPTAEESILVARSPVRRNAALTFEEILEESRGRTAFEEMDDLPNPPTLRRMRAELARLVAEGRVTRLGTGARDDPYRYCLPPPPEEL